MVTLCKDGYVRMTLRALLDAKLVHLVSGLNEGSFNYTQMDGSHTSISGYTEWTSVTKPIITLGWEWQLDVSQELPSYVRLNAPKSNIMLVSDIQHDLGSARTSMLLEGVIDMLAWQEEVREYITARYA